MSEISRRVSKKIDDRRGVQLSADDLDLLVAAGIIGKLGEAAAEEQRNQCLQRSARSRSISAETSSSTPVATGPISRSSGTMPPPDASEALQRARQITGRLG
ncbi:hypothetical protein [uncultured Sphingomonas sp.]|uniref:hypothetical protein n=1 Tax=uncultured Sphingomonas sp. TaxID=158754 RepID=UPI0025EE5E29|nr:hypothetical protein [uncultured Sphingomonas sp.]